MSQTGGIAPAKCIGCEMKVVIGDPDPSTSAVLRGAPEPHHANVDAALYPVDEWLQQESREPLPRGCVALYALQLLPGASDVAGYASDGSGNHRSRLERGRRNCVAAKAHRQTFHHWQGFDSEGAWRNRLVFLVR